MQPIKIIIEKHPDGYVAYPIGIKGIVVGEGDTYEEALADVKSAIQSTSKPLAESLEINSVTEDKMKPLPEIERILRDQKPILREKFKVREIGIFGSVVRGEQKQTSDLDLLVEFEEPIGLIKYVNLQNYLSDKVGSRVDLVMKSGLKPRISRHVLKEVIYV